MEAVVNKNPKNDLADLLLGNKGGSITKTVTSESLLEHLKSEYTIESEDDLEDRSTKGVF